MRYQIIVEKIKCDFCDKVIGKKKVIYEGGNELCSEECLELFRQKKARQQKIFEEKTIND